jgi:hypothetical protein
MVLGQFYGFLGFFHFRHDFSTFFLFFLCRICRECQEGLIPELETHLSLTVREIIERELMNPYRNNSRNSSRN